MGGHEKQKNRVTTEGHESPEAVQIARRVELEFMDKLAALKEGRVEQCWSETNAKPFGTKWIDISKGDGDRVEIRSRLVATDLKVRQGQMGVLPDDVFNATPPLDALRFLMTLMMTESMQDRSYKNSCSLT